MDNAAKMYVVTSVLKKIPCIGKDFEIALAKRFPKAFQINIDNNLVPKLQHLSYNDYKILVRVLDNTGDVSPSGQFFSVENFWGDLVFDQRQLGERATVALAKILNVKMSDVCDVVIPSVDYPELMLLVRNGQHKTISLKKARNLLRKDHYQALVKGWGSYYGPLFNWL